MGGSGSGRQWTSIKSTTSEYLCLDVRSMNRQGLLVPGRTFELSWSQDDKVIAAIRARTEEGRLLLPHPQSTSLQFRGLEYVIAIQWTNCNYGGKRPWFVCPARGCGRRSVILYGGAIFACRYCYGIVYPSQRQSDSSRAIKRAQAIRMKLGGSGNLLEPFPLKPKGMHWATYERLSLQAEQAFERGIALGLAW